MSRPQHVDDEAMPCFEAFSPPEDEEDACVARHAIAHFGLHFPGRMAYNVIVLSESNNPAPDKRLSPNEMAIMDALWRLNEATGKQLLGAIDRPLAHTTLLTYLARMEAKGFVRRSPSSHGYIYVPAVARTSVAARLLDQVLAQFEGRFSALVSHFVSTRTLSEDERHRLREVLDLLEEDHP